MSDRDAGPALFAGAERARMYQDPTGQATTPVLDDPADARADDASPATTEEARGVIRDESPSTVEVLPSQVSDPRRGGEVDLLPSRRAEQASTPGLWQRLLIKMGAAPAPPSTADLADRENERIVRQSTWTRAMSAVVLNPKGGSMKTPLTLLLAGAIAEIRGGGVAAWESTEVPGDLAAIAEGDPQRGLTELIAAGDMVTSAGNLAGYSAPQTSHAAVFGSVSARDELSPRQVRQVRDLLGTYYQIDIADTANNLQRPSLRELLAGADAVVIPCVVNHKSVRGLQRALAAVDSVPGLRDRVVLAISHDGGPEDAEFASHLIESLTRNYRVAGVVDVPFDPAIRADGELTLSALRPQTHQAIRAIARHVVECFNAAPTTKNPAGPTPADPSTTTESE